MRFGTQDQAFFPTDIKEKFQFIKELGFETYEIDGNLLVEHVEEVKEAMKETGILVETACNGYDGWIGDFIEERRLRGIEQISDILRALAEVGGKGIVRLGACLPIVYHRWFLQEVKLVILKQLVTL